jgi:hypothetical protein
MHRSVLVKSVQDHHFQGMADKGFKTITLDMPHLDSTNQYNFEPAWDTNNGEAPAAGIHIDCDIKESVTKKGMKVYNIATWSPAGPPNGGPKHISAAIPNNIPQTLNQEATLTNPALEKEASMFVMGTVGRACMGLGGDMFPSQQKLTEMVRTTKRAYLDGMRNDSGS